MTNYISIGLNCDIAINLRKKNLKTYTFPFCWNIKNYNSIIKLLNNDFKYLFDKDKLIYTTYTDNYKFDKKL